MFWSTIWGLCIALLPIGVPVNGKRKYTFCILYNCPIIFSDIMEIMKREALTICFYMIHTIIPQFCQTCDFGTKNHIFLSMWSDYWVTISNSWGEMNKNVLFYKCAKSKATGNLNVSFFCGYLSMGVIKIGCYVTQNIRECPFKTITNKSIILSNFFETKFFTYDLIFWW